MQHVCSLQLNLLNELEQNDRMQGSVENLIIFKQASVFNNILAN